MFNNVIVGIRDYEAGRDAVALAKEFATGGRPLTLAYVEVVWLKPDPDSGAAWQEADCRDALELHAALRDEFRLDAESLCVEANSVAHGLRGLVASRGADLLVIGASRRDEYERTYVGDDTRDVLKKPPCDVAMAPIGFATRAGPLKKIGIGYDGSPASARALAIGRQLVQELGGSLSALQAVPVPIRSHDSWYAPHEMHDKVEAARTSIAQLGDVEAHAASGDAADLLAHYGTSVDLLVLGSHKHSLIDDLMSGSTTQRLADKASCPLLVLASGT